MKTEADFPRFKYHLNLVHQLLHHAQQNGIAISSSNLESTILILGRITEEYRNLFKPLTFENCLWNGKQIPVYAHVYSLKFIACKFYFNSDLIYFLVDQSKTNVIKILLADTVDSKCRETSFYQVFTIKFKVRAV